MIQSAVLVNENAIGTADVATQRGLLFTIMNTTVALEWKSEHGGSDLPAFVSGLRSGYPADVMDACRGFCCPSLQNVQPTARDKDSRPSRNPT